jgi:predicted RNA-binding Zn-ribbon protein involved in translation (DUF1610 family)
VRKEVIGNATRIRAVATCTACLFAWKPTGDRTTEKCPACGKRRDVRHREFKPNIEALKTWRARNPGYATKFSRRYREIALKVIGAGQIKCVRCGCDDQRLIEINHKNGGGGKELRGNSHKFYISIARLKRTTDDLELLCRVCNAAHFLESKYGELPFLVVWRASAV